MVGLRVLGSNRQGSNPGSATSAMIMRKSFNLFEPQFIPLCKKAGFRKLYLNELLNCSDKTLFIPTVSALDLACEPQFTEP